MQAATTKVNLKKQKHDQGQNQETQNYKTRLRKALLNVMR